MNARNAESVSAGAISADGPGRVEERTGELSEFVRRALIAIGPDRKRLALVAALAFLVGVLETTLLFLIAFIAVAITNDNQTLDLPGPGPLPELNTSIGGAVLIAGGLLLAAGLAQVPLSRSIAQLSSRAIQRMRTATLRSYLAASTEYRSTQKEGYLLQLIGEYCGRSEFAVQQLALLMVPACMLSVFGTAAILTNPLVALGAILAMFITAVLLRPFAARTRRNADQHATINREVVRRIAQTTRLSDEITTFDVGGRVADELSHDIRRAAEYLRRLRYEARFVPALSQYGLIGTVLLLIAALSILASTALRDMAPLILLMVRAIGYVRQLVTASRSGIQLVPYLDLLQAELVTQEANEAYRGPRSPRSFAGVDLQGVGFEYKPGQPVLTDVNLSIRPGEVVGLLGPSGSGKTTLSQLIVRLRAPTAGSVTTGGISLWDVSPAAWSRISAYVPQDTKVILATAAENIRFFREGYDGGRIEAAAQAAHIHDELEALPQGYDTLIGPGARNLSGGQRQRLAIARALLAEPQLIVLDEPTSALDARSERLVSKTLEELRGTTAMVLIAHRPAPLAVCDRVFRVTAGSVEEIDPVSVRAS